MRLKRNLLIAIHQKYAQGTYIRTSRSYARCACFGGLRRGAAVWRSRFQALRIFRAEFRKSATAVDPIIASK